MGTALLPAHVLKVGMHSARIGQQARYGGKQRSRGHLHGRQWRRLRVPVQERVQVRL